MNLQYSTSPLCRAKGNTIAEYVMIGVLILTGSLFILLNFGHGYAQRILGISDNSALHAERAARVMARMRTDASLSSVTTMAGLDGRNRDRDYLLDTMVVQATGSNGDTTNSRIFGNTGKSGSGGKKSTPANQLKAMVKQLANQAHQIAQMESMLSTISKYSGGNPENFQAINVRFQGQTMSANSLAAVLTQGNAIQALKRQKEAIMDSNASPRLKNTISRITDAVVQAAENTSHHVSSGETDVDRHVSNSTHQNAGKICKAGGNHDNGHRCG